MPRIYLSPSLQDFNLYDGGGNEEEYMNLIADAMVPYLRATGIELVRNNLNQTLPEIIAQSNRDRYGMHVALHSNASPEGMEGQLTGPDIYYNPANRESQRFAEILADRMREIYPKPQKVNTRPSKNLAEVLQTHNPAVLLETAYHDNPQDAQWIRDNVETIARTVVQALAEYFGIPFQEPQPIRAGIVRTGYQVDGHWYCQGAPGLNVRSMPSTHSIIVAVVPCGEEVTIYSRTGDWYVISYRNATGYVYADYVEEL